MGLYLFTATKVRTLSNVLCVDVTTGSMARSQSERFICMCVLNEDLRDDC
jgi:hypothetical protein